MKRFASLYNALDTTTSTNEKVAVMASYFSQAPSEDAAWALYFLTGRRFKRFISSRLMGEWFLETTHMPQWLFSDCYESVGDTAETIALLMDNYKAFPQASHREKNGAYSQRNDVSLSQWISQLLTLKEKMVEEQKAVVLTWWQTLDRNEIFLVNKLLSGSFRVGVAQTLVVKAIAQVAELPAPTIAHRLMGNWQPTAEFFEYLISPEGISDDTSRPYPFFLAYPLEQEVQDLGPVEDWLVEWKWDGIRAQLIKRNDEVYLWSRGEELVSDRFPEIMEVAKWLPNGTVLDGEILAFNHEQPMPFAVLQTRIGRKTVSKKLMTEAPVVFMAFDLLELNNQDIREKPLSNRRSTLMHVLSNSPEVFRISTSMIANSWEEVVHLREESRARNVEGFLLKRLSSSYQTGRKKGDWWKWKVDPFTVDAVLIYAQAGHGRRSNLYTDYTFAVWNHDRLVPIAKAYSGLSNEEIETLDQWIRQNTVEKFGPVRSVEPSHVFELAFEGIAQSSRHKSGVALRFPRIARWRTDKKIQDADTLEQLKELMDAT